MVADMARSEGMLDLIVGNSHAHRLPHALTQKKWKADKDSGVQKRTALTE